MVVKSALFLIWVVDSLVKVLPSTLPPQQPEQTIRIECARNEWESGQLVFRSEVPVKRLAVTVTALRQAGGSGVIDAQNLRARFAGMIRVMKNVPNTPPEQLVAKAPALIPDVLLEDASTSVPANFSQPVWITLHVPQGTPAGTYRGVVEVDADGVRRQAPLEVTVFDFDLPEKRNLFVTNWFSDGAIARHHHVEPYTDAYFKILSAYARDMAEHRQNVFWVPWSLVKVTRESGGRLSFDYRSLDRYVQTFLDAGPFDRIEIQHVAHFEKDWSSTNIVLSQVDATDRATGKGVTLPADEGLGPLLAALQSHLDQKGWLGRSMIHVADEASMHNIESYRRASAFVHRHAPRLRRIDAIETVNYQDALEVWVPKLNQLDAWYPWFRRAQGQGNELWFYICLFPRGSYMNRLMDYPLIETRLLHWLNYRYALPGYLHWGLNHWRDPFGPQGDNKESGPAGDAWIIYPGKNGPLSSIRWESERDGIEDFEYFTLLEQRQREAVRRLGAAAAGFDAARQPQELCQRLVRSFTDYQTDPVAFRQTRRVLAREIEQAAAEPLVLWETLPDENRPLVPDPLARIVVHGVTRPGTDLKLNGKPVTVAGDGRFLTDTATVKVDLEARTGAGERSAAKRQTRTITVKD